MAKTKTPAGKGMTEPASMDAWQRLQSLSETGQVPHGRSPEMDGRRLRATGRTIQFNIKVKPEFRDEIFHLAADRSIGMAAMLEIILAEWKDKGGAGA